MLLCLGMGLLVILILPHFSRVVDASLYADDVNRIFELQTRPLGELMFRPFNEHMAPFFETVSWVTWQAADRRLTSAPIAFTLSSYVPFALCLGLLAAWIFRETKSAATALSAAVLFGLLPLSVETIYWYSASSFTWALFWTMLAFVCSGPAGPSRSGLRLAGLLVGSFLAPASSAIGLLAGPLASLRLAAGREDRRAGWLATFAPSAGTLLYLAICSAFRYLKVLKSGLANESDRFGGLLLAFRAPTGRLLPGLFGAYDADLWLPSGLNLGLTVVGLLAVILWGVRSRHRGLIVVCLGMILGGYAITYPFRNTGDAHWLFRTERFHLFPQLGLVVLIALGASRWLRRYDRSLMSALASANVLGVVLLAIHFGRFEKQAGLYRFPEQRLTLASLEHLGAICRDLNVTRDRCIADLEPTWNRWYQPCYNGLWMVPAPIVTSGPAAPEVRQQVLARLSAAEREALWGGMDVSLHARTAEEFAAARLDCLAIGRLVESDQARCLDDSPAPGMRTYTLKGWPAYLEYGWAASGSPSRSEPMFLCLPCGASSEPLEIWWSSRNEPWSPGRSVRFSPDPERSPGTWILPLASLPHWQPKDNGRLRVRFKASPIAIGEPRLLR